SWRRSRGSWPGCGSTNPAGPTTSTPPGPPARGHAHTSTGRPVASRATPPPPGVVMHRFVQPMPPPADPYTGDPLLASWLRRHLGGDDRAAASRLTALAADVTGPLREAHHQAEANPPRLVRYDAWGGRVDRVETPAGWETHRRAAARHALVALPYQSGARAQWGSATRVVHHALLHVYGPESATFSCPVAMSDGAAALLCHPEVDASIRDAWLPRLTSTDPDVAITSGQWMTESTGGSDLSGATTT